MPEKLTASFPTQGWKQFLTGRKEMLDAFDRARQKAGAHKVEVFHGRVAEAEFRKWLSSFLPKRYGVTSGYIISPGLKSSQKLAHFDVIIYDQIESPVLWIEDSPDSSQQGRALAIPVEHVHGVIEVKSRFSASTMEEGIEHLKELSPLLGGMDGTAERYKVHLPASFCCGLLFFELGEEQKFSESALKKLIGIQLRGFFDGIILRGEGHPLGMSGKLALLRFDKPMDATIGKTKQSLLSGTAMTESVQISESIHLAALLVWGENMFALFAFDLIAMMGGTYEAGMLSSFYGLGGVAE